MARTRYLAHLANRPCNDGDRSAALHLHCVTMILQCLTVVTVTVSHEQQTDVASQNNSRRTHISITAEPASVLPGWAPLPLHLVNLVAAHLQWTDNAQCIHHVQRVIEVLKHSVGASSVEVESVGAHRLYASCEAR